MLIWPMLMWNVLGSCLVLFILAAAVMGSAIWVQRFRRLQGLHPELALVLGLGFLLLNVLLLGLLGLYQAWIISVLLIVLLLGLRNFKPNKHLSAFEGPLYWLLFPAGYFLVRFVSNTIPHQHSDPIYYHLYAAKYWAYQGAIRLEFTHPSFAQATVVEPLYGLVHLFGKKFASTVDAALSIDILALLSAQQMHLWLGHGLMVLLGARFMAGFRNKASNKLHTQDLFFSWLASVPYFFEWSSAVAKTDYFLALFTLATLVSLQERRWYLSGFFIGLAFATKLFAVWTLVVLPVLLPLAAWPVALLGFACGSGLHLARNIIQLRNPVFPALDSLLGPGWISEKWAGSNAGFAGAPALPDSWHWYSKQVFDKPLSYLLLTVFVLAPLGFPKDRRKELFRWWLFLAGQIAVGVLILKSTAEGRYFGPVAATAVLFGFTFVGFFLKKIGPLKKYAGLLILLGLLVNIPVDVLAKLPFRYWFKERDLYLKQFVPVFEWQNWANRNLAKNAKLVSLNEKQNYYLRGFLENTAEMKVWEERIKRNQNSAESLASEVADLGYDYLHYYPTNSRFQPWYELPKNMESLAKACKLCSKDSMIIDLTIYRGRNR